MSGRHWLSSMIVHRRLLLATGLTAALRDEHGDDRAYDAELNGQVSEVKRPTARAEVNPVHDPAASETGRAEQPVGEVAAGTAEHGREAQRGGPAADGDREADGQRRDRESGDRD